MKQEPLFPVPKPPPVHRPASSQSASGQPKWSRYKSAKRVKCSHCMQVLAERKGNGPAVHSARYKRTVGDETAYLCYQHASNQRTLDGMEPLK